MTCLTCLERKGRIEGGLHLSCEKCSRPKPFCWTGFGSQKWSGGKLWHLTLTGPRNSLTAKRGSTLPKVVLGGGLVLVSKSGSDLGCQSVLGEAVLVIELDKCEALWGEPEETPCVCVCACVCESTSARMYPFGGPLAFCAVSS